jgi:hypothetical protein
VSAFAAEPAARFSSSTFAAEGKENGVVLVSANWARRWRCGAFENAQLQSLGFDRAGVAKSPEESPDILIEDGSWLTSKPGFVNFALTVVPGEYLLSGYKIKAAKSISEVGYFRGDRANLVADGKSKAGSFTVQAGEVVYIGHFALDCAQAPMPWRYYPETKTDFSKYLEGVAKEYPGLPVDRAKFRLFHTTVIGNRFEVAE